MTAHTPYQSPQTSVPPDRGGDAPGRPFRSPWSVAFVLILLVYSGLECVDAACGLGTAAWCLLDGEQTLVGGRWTVVPLLLVTVLAGAMTVLFFGWARSVWQGRPLRGVYLAIGCVLAQMAIVVAMRSLFARF